MSMQRAALLTFLICLIAAAHPAISAVERVEILLREPFADGHAFGEVGAYERIKGRLHYAVDPDDPANADVVDLKLAPVDDRGLVTFVGDFILLRPAEPDRGNRTLLYEVNNRGNLGMLPMFSFGGYTNNPRTIDHAGDGLLFEQGYTLLWSAWNWDVTAGGERLLIDLPIATDRGRPITGPLAAEFVLRQASRSAAFMWGNSIGYPPVDIDDPKARLTWRHEPGGKRREVPRDRWRFSDVDTSWTPPQPTRITADQMFIPGRIYEVVYDARDPRVVGLGLASIRDAISYFRFDDREISPALDRSLIFGISQSGRVINHLLWQGFHQDERGRAVIDGAFVHVAGAGKGSFNHRFAQTTRHPSQLQDQQYPADVFPFTTVPVLDRVTGERGSMLDRVRASGKMPKIVYTTTSSEYWTRAASLLHTDVDGREDVPLAPEARLYFFAGAQHGIWRSANRWPFEHCINNFDHRFGMRALLTALQSWMAEGVSPPGSVYPTFAAGTLGTVEDYLDRFPDLPDFPLPNANLRPPRLDLGPRFAKEGIADHQPARFGPPFATTVPLPDEDGIDLGGIRLPGVAAPLSTRTGWNLRRSEIGAGGKLARWSGSMLPFASDETERARTNDPRLSIMARYGSKDGYATAIAGAAEGLLRDGFLLAEDVPSMTAAALRRFDKISRRRSADLSCDYSIPDA
jgi:hypothetical protein